MNMSMLMSETFLQKFDLYFGEHVDFESADEVREAAKGLVVDLAEAGFDRAGLAAELREVLSQQDDAAIIFLSSETEINWASRADHRTALHSILKAILAQLATIPDASRL